MDVGYIPVTGDALTRLLVDVFRLNGALLGAGDRIVADLGLTSSKWQVLSVIANAPAPLPIASIARNMGLSRQGVRQTVSDLDASGLVGLAANPHHRRASLVVLTPAGRHRHDLAKARWTRWLSGLGEGEATDTLESAARLMRNVLSRVDGAAEQALRTVEPIDRRPS